MTKPAKISRTTYMQALALYTVATKHYVRCREMEMELCELLGFEDNYAGCISDEIYEDGDFDRGLKREKIAVEPRKAKAKR